MVCTHRRSSSKAVLVMGLECKSCMFWYQVLLAEKGSHSQPQVLVCKKGWQRLLLGTLLRFVSCLPLPPFSVMVNTCSGNQLANPCLVCRNVVSNAGARPGEGHLPRPLSGTVAMPAVDSYGRNDDRCLGEHEGAVDGDGRLFPDKQQAVISADLESRLAALG